MSGPMSLDVNRARPTPVTCTSSWLCREELATVLLVSSPGDIPFGEDGDPSMEECVILEAPSSETSSPCELVLCCSAQGTERILSLNICSQARTIEVYRVSQEGQEEEYLGTDRASKTYTVASSGEDGSITLYETHLTLDFPVASCKVKLLSLSGKQRVVLCRISVQISSVSERCSPAASFLGPAIDLDRVQSIMDSMGGKLSPGAEQLMGMVRAQQKSPFGGHFLQMFSAFDRGVGRNTKGAEPKLPNFESSKLPSASTEIVHTQTPNLPVSQEHRLDVGQPSSEVKSAMASLLQNPLGCIGGTSYESLMPLLQSFCLDNVPHACEQLQDKEEPCVPARDEKSQSNIEKMVCVRMEQMERTLLDHIDNKMESLQQHLDARLDLLMNVLKSKCTVSLSYPGSVGNILPNGQPESNGKDNCSCNGICDHHTSDISGVS
ncbi:ATPase PAAT isoform X2 [Xenopus laevis]|uniref:ATPase PAAT isoform X2 n=1 Tax=Xenopus laevis TaxID=8355 RepID=A0A8J0T799_XENLA|nr:ATPase PAAT isoform X2 [Xenopus laevis]